MDQSVYSMVLDTINQATSQDTQLLKPAEKKLQEWEIEPGFYSVLLSIMSEHSLDVNVRWLAVMCFKNGVDRYWRRNAPNAITDEEKERLRSGLLTTHVMSEPVAQVATQIAVLISKIARFDCPNNWPSLVPELLGALKAPQPLVQHRSLLTFHHIVKALASKRLTGDRLTFHGLTSMVYGYILTLWHENTELFLRHIQQGAATELITEHLERALLCLRILRKLTIFGFRKNQETEDAVAFLDVVFDRAKSSLECREYGLFLRHIQQGAATDLITEHLEGVLLCLWILRKLTIFGFRKNQETEDAVALLDVVFDRAKLSLECRKLLKGRGIYPLELCEKFIIHLTKVALGVLEAHPFLFVPLVRRALEFALYYCFTEQGMTLIYERFTIQCLNLIKGILLCVEYKLPRLEAAKEPGTLQAHEMKMSVLTESTVCHICRHLLGHFFLLTSDDLALWDAEPESFATDEAGESWKYSMRPCTEAVFLELFHEFREALAPELVRLLAAVQTPPPFPTDMPSVLRKDAVYNAVGLAAFDLYDDVDFDEWFTKVLNEELKVKDNNYRVIRRRVCQLIGQWSGVRASSSLRPAMYSALLQLLADRGEDAAVKLAAADALRATIDDFNFDSAQFEPYAPHAFAALYDLLVESEECDTKMRALHVLKFVMERNGTAAAGGHTLGLLQYLPQLWAHAARHDMLRAAVLSTLVDLIKALGEMEPGVRAWVVGVVGESTRLSEPQHVYLLEDAMELWLAALEAAQQADPALLQLATNLYPILELSSEHLRTAVYIMQAYTLLCPEEFLLGEGGKCMALLEEMLSDMRAEGVLTVLKVAEVCVSVDVPERNAYLGVKVVWPILVRAVRGLLHSVDLPMVLSVQLCLLSRVILQSPDLFYKIVSEVAASTPELESDPAKVLERVLDVWTERMNYVTQVERWKVIGLGLAALLTTENNIVLLKFPAILLNLTEVLNDVMKTDENGGYVDGVLASRGSRPASPLEGRGGAARWEGAAWGGGGAGSPHDARRRRLAAAHPARSVDMRAAVHHQLDKLRAQVGAEAFARLVCSCDQETLNQIREYIPL